MSRENIINQMKEDRMISQSGTWFLSWLSERGDIENHDIFEGTLHGTLLNPLFGAEKGSYVYIKMKSKDTLVVYHAPPQLVEKYDENEDNDEYWWKQEFTTKTYQIIKLNFAPLEYIV